MNRKEKEELVTCSLAIRQKDISFRFTNGRLISLVVSEGKLVELAQNGLIGSDNNKYKAITILNSGKKLIIPIHSNSFKFSRYRNREVMYVRVKKNEAFTKNSLQGWILKKTRGNNEETSSEPSISNYVI